MLPPDQVGGARGSAPPTGGLLHKGFDRAAFCALAESVGTRKSPVYDTPEARRTRKLAFKGRTGGLLILGIGWTKDLLQVERIASLSGQLASRCDDPKAMPRDRKVAPVGRVFAGDLDVIPTQAFGQGTKTCRSQERPVKPSGRLDFCVMGLAPANQTPTRPNRDPGTSAGRKSMKVTRSLTIRAASGTAPRRRPRSRRG